MLPEGCPFVCRNRQFNRGCIFFDIRDQFLEGEVTKMGFATQAFAVHAHKIPVGMIINHGLITFAIFSAAKKKSTIRAEIIFHFDRNFKVTIFFIGDNNAAITWNILASNDCSINNLPFPPCLIFAWPTVPCFRTYMPALHSFSIKNADPLSFLLFLSDAKA